MIDGPFVVPVAMFVMAGITAIFFPIARAYARKLESQAETRGISPEMSARLERMEQALDTIAVEVERISEAQRFTTKLLSERPSPRPADEPRPSA